MILKIIFWILAFIIFYTFFGYALTLFVLLRLKKIFNAGHNRRYDYSYEPNVCLFVTAFNEKDYVKQKVEN
jgi:hypothetical protein